MYVNKGGDRYMLLVLQQTFPVGFTELFPWDRTKAMVPLPYT